MALFLRKLHQYYYRFVAVATLVVFYPFLYYFSRKPERYPVLNKIRRICSFIASTAAGIFYRVRHEEAIDWSRTYIVCPNHTSNLDILSMSVVVRNNCHFIAKDDLLNNPLTGIFLRTVDIPINRESKRSSYMAYKKMEQNLKDGSTLIIFPEGKIGDEYPPVLHDFKGGPFKLAIELKIPIIPVTSLNTWKLFWDSGDKLGSRPGICDIYLHKPIETGHLTIDDADKLEQQVYDVIHKKYTDANR